MQCATCGGSLPPWYSLPTDATLTYKSTTGHDGRRVYFCQDAATGTVRVYCQAACYAAGPEHATTQARIAREGYGRITGVIMEGKHTQSYRRHRDRALWKRAHAPNDAPGA